MEINELFFIGHNRYGQAGLGQQHHNKSFKLPKPFAFNVFIKQLSCGVHHSALLTIDGSLYTMGSNTHGALGSSSPINYSFLPILVNSLRDVSKVHCGAYHTCAISEGQLYSWGKGMDGQLGHGNMKNLSQPMCLSALGRDVDNVSCGTNHTLVIMTSRSVYSFGNGIFGQLGLGSNRNSNCPAKMKIEKVDVVSAGENHSLLLSDGKVFGCGDNTSGQMGIALSKKYVLEPTEISVANEKMLTVEARRCSSSLGQSGKIYTWGISREQVRVLNEQRDVVDIRLGVEELYGLDANGALYSWNLQSGERETLISNYRVILDFSIGGSHSLILGDIIKEIPISEEMPQELTLIEDYEISTSRVSSQRNQKMGRKQFSQSSLQDCEHHFESRVVLAEQAIQLVRPSFTRKNLQEPTQPKEQREMLSKGQSKENLSRDISSTILGQASNCLKESVERRTAPITPLRQNNMEMNKMIGSFQLGDKSVQSRAQRKSVVNGAEAKSVSSRQISEKGVARRIDKENEPANSRLCEEKIDIILQMLEKSSRISCRDKSIEMRKSNISDTQTGDKNQGNRQLRMELREKQMKISQLQEILSRKQMEIEAQREVIKMLRKRRNQQ